MTAPLILTLGDGGRLRDKLILARAAGAETVTLEMEVAVALQTFDAIEGDARRAGAELAEARALYAGAKALALSARPDLARAGAALRRARRLVIGNLVVCTVWPVAVFALLRLVTE